MEFLSYLKSVCTECFYNIQQVIENPYFVFNLHTSIYSNDLMISDNFNESIMRYYRYRCTFNCATFVRLVNDTLTQKKGSECRSLAFYMKPGIVTSIVTEIIATIC